MALPGSRMSAVISLGSEIFHKRAEEAIKTSPIINCLGNIDATLADMLVYTHPDSNETFFHKDDESNLYLMLAIKLSKPPALVNAHLQLQITAEADEEDAQSFRLTLGYHDILFELGEVLTPDNKQKLQNAAIVYLNPVLSNFAPVVPLGALLATDTELVDSPLLRIPNVDMNSADRQSEPTLVIGLEFSTDNGVNRNRFMEDFKDDPRGSASWHISVDDRLILARVNQELTQIDFTQDSDTGIDNWIATTETRAFWTGENVEGQLFMPWHEGYVSDNMADHPIWFKVVGFYRIGSIATESYALGYADLSIETDADDIEQITVNAHIFAAGSGIIPVTITDDNQPPPTPIAPAEVAPNLSVNAFSYGQQFLACSGMDSHIGLVGNGEIQVVNSLSLVLDRSRINPCGGVMGYTQSAHLYGQSGVEAELNIRNIGEAPLWICSIATDDPDSVFELAINAQFPLHLPAGDSALLKVHYNSPDTAVHTGQLIISCNDLYDRHYSVTLTGQLYGGLHSSVISELGCFRKPENMPPPDWYESFGGIINNIDTYVDGTITPEHLLEVRVGGMSRDTVIHILDGRGTSLLTSIYAENAHHMSIPPSAKFMKVEGKPLEKSPLSIMMSVSRGEKVGYFKADKSPVAYEQDRHFVYAAFPDRVAIISVHDPQKPTEIATLAMQNAGSVRLVSEQLVVSNKEGIQIFDISDPYSPTLRHRMKPAPFDVYGDQLVIGDDTSLRIYNMRSGSLPSLHHVLKLSRPPQQLKINRREKAIFMTSEADSYSVHARSLSNADLAHAKTVQALESKGAHQCVRQYLLEIRPNKDRGGFDIVQQRYGDLRLHTGRIEKQLNRRP